MATSQGGAKDQYVDETYICNLALGRIGEKHIMSILDENQNARWCKRFYYHSRDELLRQHKWNFATGYADLSRLATTGTTAWTYTYGLPVDFIRAQEVNGWSETERFDHWELGTDGIYTDEESVELRYTKRITDASKFDPLFVSALSLKVAAKIVKPITNSQSELQAILQEFNALDFGTATRVDASEKRKRKKPIWVTSDLVMSRFS
jgi:hypothetical protein